MATAKKKKPAKRKSVSGTRTSKTTTKKTTKRRSVGAIINAQMAQMAAGMVISSIATKALLGPAKNMVPGKAKLFVDPVLAIVAYKGSQMTNNALMKGIALGVMTSSSIATFETIKLFTGGGTMQNISGDTFIDLPQPSLGEIKEYLGADFIPQTIAGSSDNGYATMQDIGATIGTNYLPYGWEN